MNAKRIYAIRMMIAVALLEVEKLESEVAAKESTRKKKRRPKESYLKLIKGRG